MTQIVECINEEFNRALVFATERHGNQVRKGSGQVPYIAHPTEVAITILRHSDLPPTLARRAAVAGLLHDVVEETSTTLECLAREFDEEISRVVAAHTIRKRISEGDETPSREMQVRESIARIKELPRHFWVVRPADRISNLGDFPRFWERDKIAAYLTESVIIAHELGAASETLQAILLARVANRRHILSLLP